jgi:hypothetical protein
VIIYPTVLSEQEDVIYSFSDGFRGQLGVQKNKKFYRVLSFIKCFFKTSGNQWRDQKVPECI